MYNALFLLMSLMGGPGGHDGPGGHGGPGRHAGPRTYQLFYIDNSHTRGYQNFSPNMLDVLSAKIDSIHWNRNDDIAVFSSNGEQPEFVANFKGAKSVVDKLSNGYTAEPYSPYDKSTLIGQVANTDLSDVKALNIYFFVTESYLTSDLLKTNSGLLFNILPEELRFLLGCDQGKVNVFIYYPAAATSIKESGILGFCRLKSDVDAQGTGIKYHVQGI